MPLRGAPEVVWQQALVERRRSKAWGQRWRLKVQKGPLRRAELPATQPPRPLPSLRFRLALRVFQKLLGAEV